MTLSRPRCGGSERNRPPGVYTHLHSSTGLPEAHFAGWVLPPSPVTAASCGARAGEGGRTSGRPLHGRSRGALQPDIACVLGLLEAGKAHSVYAQAADDPPSPSALDPVAGFLPRRVRGRLFAGITMALRRPHKGMKMAPLRHTGPGCRPRGPGTGYRLSPV